MPTPLESLVATGTRLWLDSVDPELLAEGLAYGATGATSNPIIIADLIRSGRYDEELAGLIAEGLDDEDISWQMTDRIVARAQAALTGVYERTGGDDGYVSFELDPLLDDDACTLSCQERAERYVVLAGEWAAGHANRMIKVPATPAGLLAVEDIVAAGITVNVTLIFSERQHLAACEAAWRGACRRTDTDSFKSVYSIFISRIDVYSQQHANGLSQAAQGLVGIVNAKRVFEANRRFWADKPTRLSQQIVFASTGTKNHGDPPEKYVAALAGSDIQTNPPATNTAVDALSGREFQTTVHDWPSAEVLEEIDGKVDFLEMEATLMAEGLKKFADPQRELLALIAGRREAPVV